jgi:hypothetical protein
VGEFEFSCSLHKKLEFKLTHGLSIPSPRHARDSAIIPPIDRSLAFFDPMQFAFRERHSRSRSMTNVSPSHTSLWRAPLVSAKSSSHVD